MDDELTELIGVFRAEAVDQITTLEQGLLDLEARGEADPELLQGYLEASNVTPLPPRVLALIALLGLASVGGLPWAVVFLAATAWITVVQRILSVRRQLAQGTGAGHDPPAHP